jgi:CheY-like chemotaxis protein
MNLSNQAILEYIAAHDFNNMMTSVMGYSDLLLMSIPKDDPSRKTIELIRKSGVSAAALTRELLTFSRKQVVQPVLMDINVTLAGTETIMVAEDDTNVRELAVAILEEQGYIVLAVDSDQACLRRLADHSGPLDLRLTDVVMPDLNGKALAQRALERYADLKVLYMSGYPDAFI